MLWPSQNIATITNAICICSVKATLSESAQPKNEKNGPVRQGRLAYCLRSCSMNQGLLN